MTNGHMALHTQSMLPKVSRHRKKSKKSCGICGKDPADGCASIYRSGVETWFCHESSATTCYELAGSLIAENRGDIASPWKIIMKEVQ